MHRDAGLQYYIVGHVGDGNFHIAYLIDPAQCGARDRRERSTTSWCTAHWRWKAPAPASTASACTSRASWSTRRAAGRSTGDDAQFQARARPEEHPQPGKIFPSERGRPRCAHGGAFFAGAGTDQRLRGLAAAVDAVEVHAEAPQPRHVPSTPWCALSCSGRSLCWVWRRVSERSPRRFTFQTWMLGSRLPRSCWWTAPRATGGSRLVVVDGADLEVALLLVVDDGEEAEVAHGLGAQELADEALVLKLRMAWSSVGSQGAAGDVGEPGRSSSVGDSQMRLDVGVHRKAERA